MEEIRDINVKSLKLAHYFVKNRKYKPIVVRNSINDMWLENFHEQYKIIRIVLQPIINDVQLQTDLNYAFRVKKSIERNTFTYRTKMLNIYLNLGTNIVSNYKLIDSISVSENNDMVGNMFENYRDIRDHININKNHEDEAKKLTQEIQVHSSHEFSKIQERVSSKKIPYVTYAILAICITAFISMYLVGDGSNDIYTLVKYGGMHKALVFEGDFYRLITSSFLHAGLMHLIFNMYALFLLGKTTEGVLGSIKYFIVYFMSVLMGSLLSMVFVPEALHVGASGGLYGVMGALMYFGYNNRSVFGGLLRNSLVPLLAINLIFSIVVPGINFVGHLGGLVGGFFTTMALGTLNDDKKMRINGIIATIVLYTGITYMIFYI